MDAAIEQELISMYKSSMSVESIANELEISISTVRNVLKKHSLTKEDVKPNKKDADAALEYSKGTRVPEILNKYGLTYSKLYGILNRLDIPLRKTENAAGRGLALEKAVEMYTEGHPLWRITEETNIAQPTLHAELHARKIQLRRPRNGIL